MRTAPFRAARGGAVALVGVVLALAAHAVGGGEVVPGAALIPVLAVAAGCVVASARAWTVGRVVVALVAVQVVVHGSQWVVGGAGSLDPRLAGLAGARTQAHHAAGGGLSTGMVAAHGLAVLGAAALLSRVDEVVLRLWQLGRTVLGRRPARVLLVRERVLPPVGRVPARARTRALLASPRRGPPAVLAPC